MFSPSRIEKHDTLRTRMGDTLRVDMGEAMMRGRLSEDAVGLAAVRCTACGEAKACERWLDANRDGADAAPRFCRNAQLFESLKSV